MNPRKLIATAAGAALLAGGLLAPSASAADDTTTVTFTLDNGVLAISAPETKDLGTAAAVLGEGVVASASLGNTTVTDERNSTSGWNVYASSTSFTKVGGATPITADYVTIEIATLDGVTQTLNGGASAALTAGLFVNTAGGTTGDATFDHDNDAGTDPIPGGKIGELVSAELVSLATVGGLLGTTNHSITYAPTVSVAVPADIEDGVYSGTVTQTVL